jgi:hypothetical protein
MKPNFEEIVRHFEFEGDFQSADPYGTGHINDTYIANFHASSFKRRYILQRINHRVFLHPEGLMSNIKAVTDHLKRKIAAGGGDPRRETLTLIPSVKGECFIKTETGDYWRAYIFIEDAQTYEVVRNLDHVYTAAQAFGIFQKQLSDFPPEQLFETIPNFHNTQQRCKTLLQVVESDESNLASSCESEINFVGQRIEEASRWVAMCSRGELPERVTHNDTKFNNVMIDDQTGRSICVIDLDTVMPGLTLYDFGDSIRSMANPASEDEQDLNKVNFQLEVFEQLTRGYLDAARDFLTDAEIDQLPFSAILMTLECGTRFLTDHLQGDIYFRTRRKNQNLDRCRTQFKLVRDMEERYTEMEKIVEKYR